MNIRRATPDDAAACGAICFSAFTKISTEHGFPPDFPSPEFASYVLGMMFSHAEIHCVVAEVDGRIVGSNCLDERSTIVGIGPITVDPSVQNRGVGRALMDAVLERTRERKAPGVRLVQAAFHNRSLALYTSLGFDLREPLSCLQGPAIQKKIDGCEVRVATDADIDACDRLCARVHGADRGGELRTAKAIGVGVVVVERHGRVTGYSTSLGFFGHTVAETNLDLQALIASADSFAGPGILVPSRNAELLRWCLAQGLRITQPLTLMSRGLYNEPAGVYLPSIFY